MLLGLVLAAVMVGGLYLVMRPSTGNDDELKAALTADFLDPNSAEFRNIKWETKDAACGEVNGTNSFGGKVGYRKFYAVRSTASGRFEVFLSGNTEVETSLVAGRCP